MKAWYCDADAIIFEGLIIAAIVMALFGIVGAWLGQSIVDPCAIDCRIVIGG